MNSLLLVAVLAAPGPLAQIAVERSLPAPLQGTLADAPVVAPWQPGDPVRLVPRQHADDPLLNAVPVPVNPPSPVSAGTAFKGTATRAPGLPLIDIGSNDGAQGFNGVFPPDPTGDVGPTHFIQATNGAGGSIVRVFDKASGSLVAGPLTMASLAQPGSTCANSGAGDPIVLYDELAQRWLITEFTSPGTDQLCVYVSSTSDAVTSSWMNYSFSAPSFPDYPKYGVWNDAYIVTANEDLGPSVFALDRAAMLSGQEASAVRFLIDRLPGFGFQTPTPADHDGRLAPVGPGIVMRHRDDELHDPGSNNPGADFLELFEVDVDFDNPAASRVRLAETIAVEEFDSTFCGGDFDCLDQPGSTPGLDPVREVLMWRLQYRNFGMFETLVGNLVTDLGASNRSGLRFFELRRTGSGDWVLFQEGTLAPDDDDESRFMASAAMDASGNIALGYSVTGPSTFPSLRYAGRGAGDPPGALTGGEITLADGAAAQTQASRWGDYSALSVDPVDGCTFWFTSMFTPQSLWSTRIASFRFAGCGEEGFSLAAEGLSQAVCLADGPASIDPVTVVAVGNGGFDEAIALAFDDLPAGFSADVAPASIVPGEAAVATATVSPGAAAGVSQLTVRGTAGGVDDQTVDIWVDVTPERPGTFDLLVPANGADAVVGTPIFRWSTAGDADSYRFELATDPGFTAPIVDIEVQGNSLQPDVTLADDAVHFWRVTPTNACGDGDPETFEFRTAARAANGCPAGTTAEILLADDFNGGPGDWVPFGNEWILVSGLPDFDGNAWLIENVDSDALESLASPFVNLPEDAAQLLLRFRNRRNIEGESAVCFDGGQLEYTPNDRDFFLVESQDLGADPYDAIISSDFDNPAAELPAWCSETGEARETTADVSGLAGFTVSLLWTLASDSSIGTGESWIVDDVELVACRSEGPPGDEIFASGFERGEGDGRARSNARPAAGAEQRLIRRRASGPE
ncbi:MAG: hypothetical protein AAGE01_05275 [Pseudomonadota bacterium]